MTARRAILLALGSGLAAAAAAVALSGGFEPYRVRLEMASAAGLREGRPVVIGGGDVGKVDKLHLGRGDVVLAELELDPKRGRIGRGAWAKVKPTNLLGERFVDLRPGDLSSPRPSGAVIPRSRVQDSVDLDQVIDVLDADVRVRLGILINETGLAFTGRRADFNALLGELPPSLDAANQLVGDLASDNRTLGQLVESSDRFIARLTAERRALSRMIDASGQTMRTVSARRAELRQTLARAPRALSSLRRFLADLRVTTEPLGPAAQAISSTAPPLDSTLGQLEPFRLAAEPALNQAVEVAPALTELGEEATPVLRESDPVLRNLTRFADRLAPVNRMLDRGNVGGVDDKAAPIDNMLNIVHTWAQSIQTRDAASHVFRGNLVFNQDSIRQLVDRVDTTSASDTADGAGGRDTDQRRRDSSPDADPGKGDEDPTGDVNDAVQDAVEDLSGEGRGDEDDGRGDEDDPRGDEDDPRGDEGDLRRLLSPSPGIAPGYGPSFDLLDFLLGP